ncbi:hypothetical protein V5799_033149 [Amblyomma americanum]|uniref:Uncharacterized protein n=1 Tax=Amblyomma americanum TaxID=6943 RepID=A0AAQ4DP51_AMBAM
MQSIYFTLEGRLHHISGSFWAARSDPTTIRELESNFTNIPVLGMLKKELSNTDINLTENDRVVVTPLDYYAKLNNLLNNTDPSNILLIK